MPELPEVETIVRGLKSITGKSISGVKVYRESSVAFPDVETFKAGLLNKKIKQVTRRGKFIVIILNDDSILLIHLKMSGRLVLDDNRNKYCRISLKLSDALNLDFIDTRALGKQWYYKDKVSMYENLPTLKNMGVEPLEDFNSDDIYLRIKKSNMKIKTLLLDQTIICGIGNIYADEILFLAKINPLNTGNSLTKAKFKKLVSTIRLVLSQAISYGGSSIRDYKNAQGVNGNYQNYAYVYGRKDKPCRLCKSLIQKITLGGRGTHFCPKCQRL